MFLMFFFFFSSGVDGAVLCDPTELESAHADSHLILTANLAGGMLQAHVSSRRGLDPRRLPSLLVQARPAISHLSKTLRGVVNSVGIDSKEKEKEREYDSILQAARSL